MADGNDSMMLTEAEQGVVLLNGEFPGAPDGSGADLPDIGDVGTPQAPETTAPVQPQAPEDAGEPGETETTAGTEETKGAGEEEIIGIVEKEECDHVWVHYTSIGLGVLGLVLIVLVILQALRLKNMKRALKRRGSRRPQTETPVVTAPSDVIQVGKLHQLGDRSSQQDCLAVSPTELYASKGVLALVADGMGGLSDGDRMSQTAANAMMNGFMSSREVTPELILALTTAANQAVNNLLGPANQGRSGTTLVGGVVKDGLFHYVSVGDSRICLYRQGALIQLNREHVYRNELSVQAINGMGTLWDAATHPKAGGLTSYLGMGNLKYVDIPADPVRLRGGDKIVLMSDGVYNALSLLELESALQNPAQQAADAMGQMIQAKAYRNQDNYTAVILEF